MHFVTGSAIQVVKDDDPRAQRRRDTARAISDCAQRLTYEHGLDGFTMDDLAAQVGVSRRTLFNYFAGKEDAVLGGMPEIDPDQVGAQLATGKGALIDDLAQLALALIEEHETGEDCPDREQIEVKRQVLQHNPRLIALANRRFDQLIEQVLPWIAQREGSAYSPRQARMAMLLVGLLAHQSLEDYLLKDNQSSLGELFEANLAATRQLFPDPVSSR